MKKMRMLSLLLSLVMVLGICPCYASATETETTRVPRIFVMGDSMAATYPDADQVPQMGWGQTLQNFFDEDKLVVVNRARGGASSRNFYNDPYQNNVDTSKHCWTSIWGKTDDEYLTNLDLMQEGDYLIFTFGANDVKKDSEVSEEDLNNYDTSDMETYNWLQRNADATVSSEAETGLNENGETAYSYKWYMKQYVEKARARGAIPIMITPPERRVNPSGGAFAEASSIRYYRDAVIDLADELNADNNPDNDVICPDTDEDNISINTLNYYKALGDTSTGSKKLFVHLAENQYPLYEGGTVQADNTHFRDFGAVEISRIIIEQLMKHDSDELDALKSALKTVSTAFVYDSDHNTAGTAIKQTAEKTKGTKIYPRAQFINQGAATTIQVVMAGYDANGKMTNVSSSDEISVEANSITSFDVKYTMPDYAHSGKTKMFVWEKDTLIPLSSNLNEQKFLAGSMSGNLHYEEDFDDWTEVDSSVWRVTKNGTTYVSVSTLNGSSCMFVEPGQSTMSDAGSSSNEFYKTYLGTEAEDNMETVLEADVKMGVGATVSLNCGTSGMFTLYRHKNLGTLCHKMTGTTVSDGETTYTSVDNDLGFDAPDSTFHFKAVINEKEQTADIYINGIQYAFGETILGVYQYSKNTAKTYYAKFSLAGGTEGTYIDNLTLYRQPIAEAE